MREDMALHAATGVTLLKEFSLAAHVLATHRAEEAGVTGVVNKFFYVRKERTRIEGLYDEFKTALLKEGIVASLEQTSPKDPCLMLAEIIYK